VEVVEEEVPPMQPQNKKTIVAPKTQTLLNPILELDDSVTIDERSKRSVNNPRQDKSEQTLQHIF